MLRTLVSFGCLALLGLTLLAPVSLGWNKATHMAIGAMMYRNLQQTSPQTLTRVVSLLKQHPYYQTQWDTLMTNRNLTGTQRDEYLFMLAARWSDDIKGKDAYHDHFSWHFIDYVYAPQLGIMRGDTTIPTGETILEAYEQNRQILLGNQPDSSKAIALCWLFHLTGDIHMPLHTTALVNTQFPKGDQGGNLFKIKVMMSSQTSNLHSFWDGVLLKDDDYPTVDSMAVSLLQTYTRDQLPQLGKTPNIVAWSKESFQLAQDNVYRSNTLPPGADTDATVLPPDYVATVKPIAQRQVALSGYRLSDELVGDLMN
jgi:hypothetical protein